MHMNYRILTAPPRIDVAPVPGYTLSLPRWPGTTSASSSALVPRGVPRMFLDERVVEVASAVLHPRHAQRLQPVLLIGEAGCGKSESVRVLASLVGAPLVVVECTGELRVHDLLGSYTLRDGNVTWQDGAVARALRLGAWLLLDEVSMAPASVLAALHGVLTGAPLPLPTGELLHRTPGTFHVWATSNAIGGSATAANRRRYAGNEHVNAAFLSRFLYKVEVPSPDATQVATILLSRADGPDHAAAAVATQLARFYVALREKARGDDAELSHTPALREILGAWAAWGTPRIEGGRVARRRMEDVIGYTILPSYPVEERPAVLALLRATFDASEHRP